MKTELKERLNKVAQRISSPELRGSKGLGNEIAFYIFDYDPEEELAVREHLRFLLDALPKQHPGLRLAHANLFEVIVAYLKERNLLDRAVQLQRDKGNDALKNALKGPLHEEKVAQALVKTFSPEEHDVFLLSGVGTAWPFVRIHTLLNALQPVMDGKPLVVFYPGKYDGQGVSLFGRVGDGNYYRAFQLVN